MVIFSTKLYNKNKKQGTKKSYKSSPQAPNFTNKDTMSQNSY